MEPDQLFRQLSEARSRVNSAFVLPRQFTDGCAEASEPGQSDVSCLASELISAQKALDTERERYRDLFELAPVAYLVTDSWGNVRAANQAAVELLNIRPRHLTGKPLACLIAPEERRAFRSCLYRMRRSDVRMPSKSYVCPRRRPPVPVILQASVSRDLDGRLVEIRWAIHDLSQQEAAERQVRRLNADLEARVVARTAQLESQLREHEQWAIATHAALADGTGPDAQTQSLQDLVHGLDAVIWRADAQTGRYVFVSRRAEELLGYPTDRWINEPDFWTERIHPDDRRWVISNRQRFRQQGRDHEAEYRMLAADGHTLWFRESVRVSRGPTGEPQELLGLMVNISRRKKIERQLYAAKQSLSEELVDRTYFQELLSALSPELEVKPLLHEVLQSFSAILGAEMGALFLEDAATGDWTLEASIELPPDLACLLCRLAPWSPVRGRALAVDEPVFVGDAPALADCLPPALMDGVRSLYSVALRSRDNGSLGSIVVLFQEQHRPRERQTELAERYVRKAAEFIESARLRHEVREAERRKDEALATLAHELRSPLAAVLHAAETLRRPGAADVEEAREVVDRQTRHMARLVEDLLEACRLRKGIATLNRMPMDVTAAVNQAVELVRPLIDSRGHPLGLALPAEPIWIKADRDRVEQIVVNLLTNAAKFTPPGGALGVVVEAQSDEVVLRVQDAGRGMPPDLLARVFDLFVQAERSPAGGIGLGLSLVKGLAELHGGSVSASSPGPGQGSEFVVRLPRGHCAALGNGSATHALPAPTSRPPRHSILIVDDHADSAWALSRLLRADGHDTHVASDGPAALAAARTHHPDVVLLDLGLPVMSGLEVAERLRAEHGGRRMHIVAVTGREGEEDRLRCQAAGFQQFLVKPVDLAVLQALLAGTPVP